MSPSHKNQSEQIIGLVSIYSVLIRVPHLVSCSGSDLKGPRSRVPGKGPGSQVKGPRWRDLGPGSHVWVPGLESRVPGLTFPVCLFNGSYFLFFCIKIADSTQTQNVLV